MIFFQLSLKRDLVGGTRSLPSLSSIVELMMNEDKFLRIITLVLWNENGISKWDDKGNKKSRLKVLRARSINTFPFFHHFRECSNANCTRGTFIALEFLIPFWIPSIHFSTLRHTASSSIHPLWPRVFHLSSSGIVSRSSFNLVEMVPFGKWRSTWFFLPWGRMINVREFWTKFVFKKGKIVKFFDEQNIFRIGELQFTD